MNPVKSISEFFKTREPKKILVALSGGADSVCLLYALREYGAQICAFHLNHCIRGEEADRDERFCRELCEKLGIEFASKKVDVPRISAEQKCGLEETARNVRYKELELAAKRFSAEYIATAHNADDNAETVIFNIVRGCSADGLAGIPKMRGNIIRPLLDSTRAEIELYLESKNARFVYDSTNSDQNYTRNRIRHSVMPVLKEINPSVCEAVGNLCDSVSKDKAFFVSRLEAEKETLPALLPEALLTRQIAVRYYDYCGKTAENVHIKQMCKYVKERKCVTLDLPDNVCVYISYGDYTFGKRKEINDYCIKVSEGITTIPETGTKLYYGTQNVYKLATSVGIECDRIVGGLYARPRKAGDKITVFGVSKSVRKELINKKIPLFVRKSIPVICDDMGIVYVPYIGADDRAFSNSGRHILGLLCSETEK